MNVTATLFGQMITFVIFVWFIKAYLWEPLTKAMDDRTNKIADGLAAAEKGQQKIEQAEIQFTTRIDEAKTKASGIITDAEQQSKNIVDEARNNAKNEAAKIAKSSSQQLEQEIKMSLDELSLIPKMAEWKPWEVPADHKVTGSISCCFSTKLRLL